ncbi:MAG: hypothetical protein ACRD0Y_08115 [Terriglobales bacterium]
MLATLPPPPRFAIVGSTQTEGFSRAADEVANALSEALARWAPTASIGAALQGLEDAQAEASVADWSAEGDLPMSFGAYQQAGQLLATLLPWGPGPEVSTEPNGEPAFDWNFGRDRWLVASIAADGRVSFASRKGSERLRGITYFTGSAPSRIAYILADLQRA